MSSELERAGTGRYLKTFKGWHMSNIWMVRAEGGMLIKPFLEHQLAALSFGPSKRFSRPVDEDELARYAKPHYPELTARGLKNGAKQLRFVMQEMRRGDFVITYDPSKLEYWLGPVTGDYDFRPDVPLPLSPAGFAYAHTRDVSWQWRVRRHDLSDRSKAHLRQKRTVFLVAEDVAAELRAKVGCLETHL